MDGETILMLGSLLLAFGSLSLFFVRTRHERLKGLGWMAAAFASGSGGAWLLSSGHVPHVVSAVLPDLLTLLGFVLLQVAVSELLGRALVPLPGLALLAAMALVDVLHTGHRLSGSWRVSAISLFVGVQCGMTAWQLWRTGRQRTPARFCAWMLFGFSGYNLARAVLVATGLARHWGIAEPLQLFSFLLYIVVALGLAFGFFWMTTEWHSAQLEQMAVTDPLTRLCNRRAFLRACETEYRASAKKMRQFSVLMADLDHFKSINDRFGHEAGDEALLAAVESMQNAIRGIDVLARWGGEEFAVLLPNASGEAARIVAERIRANVARVELPVSPGESPSREVLRMTISIGLATFQPNEDLRSLLRRADQGLYLAKDAGRNRVLQAV